MTLSCAAIHSAIGPPFVRRARSCTTIFFFPPSLSLTVMLGGRGHRVLERRRLLTVLSIAETPQIGARQVHYQNTDMHCTRTRPLQDDIFRTLFTLFTDVSLTRTHCSPPVTTQSTDRAPFSFCEFVLLPSPHSLLTPSLPPPTPPLLRRQRSKSD